MSKVESNPLANLWNSVTKEAGRAAGEVQRHVTESINDIGKGVEQGGILGGVATAYDKLSLGNMAAGLVDSVIPGKDLPKPLMEGISAYVNLATGNPMGFVDVVQGFMGLAGPSKTKGGQPANGEGTRNAGTAPSGPPQRMQTPEAPSEASRTWAPPLGLGIGGMGFSDVGGALVMRSAGSVVVRGTEGADDIRLDKQGNGSYLLTVNGESVTLSAREARGLVINGRGGNDNIVVNGNKVNVSGGAGDDRIVVNGNNADVKSGAGNDRVTVRGDNARVDSGAGNDVVRVAGDNARVFTGRGNDTATVKGDDARLFGQAGNDRLTARGDRAKVGGGAGHDNLAVIGNGGRAYGGTGNDKLREVGSGNHLIGGPGRDERTFDNGLKLSDHIRFEIPRGFKDRAIDIGSGGFTVNDGLTQGLDEVLDILQPGQGSDATTKKLKEMEKRAAEATAELDRILSNPDLSFEDMIFMLMGALMKQAQKDVKAMTAETRDKKAAFDKEKAELTQGVNAAESKVNELEAKVRADPNNKDAAKQLGEAKSELRKLGEERNERVSDFNDSRQEQLEAIKNAMNKITEMQQALSNILNSMHQTAMSTIGNIR